MGIAETSVDEGIAIVIFATVLFLILFGLVTFLRWLFRWLSGKPKPTKFESVLVVLHSEGQEAIDDWEESEDVRNFTQHLHNKLLGAKAGHVAEVIADVTELFFIFEGANAEQIWDLIQPEVQEYAPYQPKRVVIQRSKKNGGEIVLSSIPWQPGNKPAFEPPPEICIPEGLRRMYFTGRRFAVIGIVGLFLWNGYAMISGQSENDFFGTLSGKLSAYIVGSVMIFGFLLVLVSNIRIRTHTKSVGFQYQDSPNSHTLKWVLLAVILIFTSILIML